MVCWLVGQLILIKINQNPVPGGAGFPGPGFPGRSGNKSKKKNKKNKNKIEIQISVWCIILRKKKCSWARLWRLHVLQKRVSMMQILVLAEECLFKTRKQPRNKVQQQHQRQMRHAKGKPGNWGAYIH